MTSICRHGDVAEYCTDCLTGICVHGDVAAACIDCLEGTPPEHPNPTRPKVEPVSPAWPARFPGHCAGCNLEIHEEQRIHRMSDGGYRHERCAR